MKLTEAGKVLTAIKDSYPYAYKDVRTKEDALAITGQWCREFADIPYDIIQLAVVKCISKSKFAPTINEIKEELHDLNWEAFCQLKEHHDYIHMMEICCKVPDVPAEDDPEYVKDAYTIWLECHERWEAELEALLYSDESKKYRAQREYIMQATQRYAHKGDIEPSLDELLNSGYGVQLVGDSGYLQLE